MTVHTCGRCGQLVEAGANRCRTCGRLYPAIFGQRRRLDQWFSRDYSWSKGLALALVAIYLAMVLASQRYLHGLGGDFFARVSPAGPVLDVCGAKISSRIFHGEWWRLVLANFLHLHPIHIFFNVSALLTLGGMIERLFGPARFLVLFVIGGALGFVASTWYSAVPSAGSSAGIAALLGATLAYGLKRKGNFGQSVRDEAIRWLLLLAVFGYFAPGIDNAGHFGGAMGGFLLALTFDVRQTFTGRESDGARVAAVASLALVFVATVTAVITGLRAM